MSVILFILGIFLTGAGIVTIGFGIPINEFNLGNTMIVAGTTAVAAGLILIGLAAAVDQLTEIAKALRPRAGARPAPQPQAVEQAFPGAVRPGQFPVQAPVPVPVPGQVKPPMPAPPRGPVFAKPTAEERVSEPAPAESAPEVSFSAMERLRSSLARADRKAGDVAGAQDVPYSADVPAQAAPAAPAPGGNTRADTGANLGANGAAPAGGAGAVEALKKPPLDFLFRSKSREPQPEAFDAVWPKRGARRSDEQAEAGESAKPVAAEVPIDRPLLSETLPSSAPEELRPAAILKSGVVDGMAYTLYADGSIEAQLPQGTIRFGSIAELRSHIENNS
jgi:hypothetical protein